MRAVSLNKSMTFSNDFPMKFCLYPLPNKFLFSDEKFIFSADVTWRRDWYGSLDLPGGKKEDSTWNS